MSMGYESIKQLHLNNQLVMHVRSYLFIMGFMLRQFTKYFCYNQRIIDPIGTETFAKKPKLAKLLRELK